MVTLDEWRVEFDAWAGKDPNLASTGTVQTDSEFDRLVEVLAGWLDVSTEHRLLDVGCASGTLTSRWVGRVGQIVGLDYSHKLVDKARQLHAHLDLEFIQGESGALPFPDNSFDRVLCYDVVPCLPHQDYVSKTIQELCRVAKPDARIAIGSFPDLTRKHHFFDLLDSASPWYRRVVPRELRWRAKRLLRPGSRPGETKILWFDLDRIARQLRAEGWTVEVFDDPKFADYEKYRSTIVLSSANNR